MGSAWVVTTAETRDATNTGDCCAAIGVVTNLIRLPIRTGACPTPSADAINVGFSHVDPILPNTVCTARSYAYPLKVQRRRESGGDVGLLAGCIACTTRLCVGLGPYLSLPTSVDKILRWVVCAPSHRQADHERRSLKIKRQPPFALVLHAEPLSCLVAIIGQRRHSECRCRRARNRSEQSQSAGGKLRGAAKWQHKRAVVKGTRERARQGESNQRVIHHLHLRRDPRTRVSQRALPRDMQRTAHHWRWIADDLNATTPRVVGAAGASYAEVACERRAIVVVVSDCAADEIFEAPSATT
jgi:hypothetical protein